MIKFLFHALSPLPIRHKRPNIEYFLWVPLIIRSDSDEETDNDFYADNYNRDPRNLTFDEYADDDYADDDDQERVFLDDSVAVDESSEDHPVSFFLLISTS